MEVFGVIMAGGGGTRFWPLSRKKTPKQFLNISGNDVMINETIERIHSVIDYDKVYIATNEKQKHVLEEVLSSNVDTDNVLYEPMGRNTAACICYAALEIQKKHGDGIMCVFPSDHYIKNDEEFTKVLKDCVQVAESTDKLVTIGVKPTFPSTGYGYINFDRNSNAANSESAYEVVEFVEKPPFEKAKTYVQSGNYVWNSGMFVWKVSTITDSFKRFLPKIYTRFMEVYDDLGTKSEVSAIEKLYPKLPSISIDYGIMERSDDVVTIPGDFGWNDVGSWDSLGAIFDTDDNGNIVKSKNHVGIRTKDSIVFSEDRLVATIGLDGIIVADTPDALLICRKDMAQDVKCVVERLEREKRGEYL